MKVAGPVELSSSQANGFTICQPVSQSVAIGVAIVASGQ
jgi:hypothetical protein